MWVQKEKKNGLASRRTEDLGMTSNHLQPGSRPLTTFQLPGDAVCVCLWRKEIHQCKLYHPNDFIYSPFPLAPKREHRKGVGGGGDADSFSV